MITWCQKLAVYSRYYSHWWDQRPQPTSQRRGFSLGNRCWLHCPEHQAQLRGDTRMQLDKVFQWLCRSVNNYRQKRTLILTTRDASANLSGALGIHHRKGQAPNPTESIKIPGSFLRLWLFFMRKRITFLRPSYSVLAHAEHLSLNASAEEIGTNSSLTHSCEKTKSSAQQDWHLPHCTEQRRPCLYHFI